jgi:hypothetical protein
MSHGGYHVERPVDPGPFFSFFGKIEQLLGDVIFAILPLEPY